MDLAELNWIICINYLDDAIEALKEAREHLKQASLNCRELKEVLNETLDK